MPDHPRPPTDDALRLLALAAAPVLAASDEPARCAAVLGWPLHEWLAQRARLLPMSPPGQAADAAPAGSADGPAPPLVAWFARAPDAAAPALARALALHLQHDRVEAAAPLALAFGTAAQRLALLRQAGWLLLWRPERRVLGPLLDSVTMEPDAASVLPLQLAWWIEVERVPHAAERRLRQGAELPAGVQALLYSRIAQVFDDARCALRWAEAANEALDNDLDPLALWARHALGLALLDAGRPREALPPLAALVRACTRDGLPMLALEAMGVQARVHDELADEAALRTTLQGAAALARRHGISDAPALQLLERQRRMLRLRIAAASVGPHEPAEAAPAAAASVNAAGAVDDAATRRGALDAIDTALAPPPPATHYDAFPGLVIDALEALRGGAVADAATRLAELERRLAFDFHCAKWRNAQRLVRLWWLARRPEPDALAELMQPDGEPAADSTLVEWHAAVLAAAAAALAGAPIERARLAAWDTLLAGRGLARLRGRLALINALGPPGDVDRLLAWLQAPPAQAPLLDAAWLAPKLAALLEALLATPQIAHHPAERALAQRLLQQMLAPSASGPEPAAEAGAAATTPAAPPADLTLREWQILQLIGQHYSNEQIATRLNVSVATVKTHINRVYGKLGIGSRAEAVQRMHHLAAQARVP